MTSKRNTNKFNVGIKITKKCNYIKLTVDPSDKASLVIII